MAKHDLIKQARCLMLRSLDRVYPSGLTVKLLYQVMCTVDQGYDFSLMRKDIAYLSEKGYLTLIKVDGTATLADVRRDAMTLVRLTAAGLEVVQSLKRDTALEI